MKTIVFAIAAACVLLLQTGCSTSASVGHHGHSHGVRAGVGSGGVSAGVH